MIGLPNLKTFGERLLWARTMRGITQQELADRSGISRDIIAKAETGKTKRPKKMKELSDALQVPPAWLAFGDHRIDEWDEETLEFAEDFSKLSDDMRHALKTMLENTKKP